MTKSIKTYEEIAPLAEALLGDVLRENRLRGETAPATHALSDGGRPLGPISAIGEATTEDFTDIRFIFGTEDDDVIDAPPGPVVVQGLGGNDTITGANNGASWLSGDAGDDVVVGHGFNNTLIGGDGNDHLVAVDGHNAFQGGAGDDRLGVDGGNNAIDGGDGFDTVAYGLAPVTVNLVDNHLNGGAAAGDSYVSVEQFLLSASNDDFLGANAADTVFGFGGNVFLSGGAGDDMLDGGTDNDSLDGGDGNDILRGGSFINREGIEQPGGDDLLSGGNGNDILDGGNGDDVLNGGAGADILAGGAGHDFASYNGAVAGVSIDLTKASSTWTGDAQGDVLTGIEEITLTSLGDIFRGDDNPNVVDGSFGDDQIYGLGGDDDLMGSRGNDSLYGGNGNDRLVGDGSFRATGNDYLQGNAGNDTLLGGRGNDTLVGGSGNDSMSGGLGGDKLVGETGVDVFQYAFVEESQAIVVDGVNQLDQIVDFVQGEDKIDLSAIDADPAVQGDQAFAFVADPAHYIGDWSGVVWETTDIRSGRATINVSVDDDPAAEMQIDMSHPYQFTAGDFIL